MILEVLEWLAKKGVGKRPPHLCGARRVLIATFLASAVAVAGMNNWGSADDNEDEDGVPRPGEVVPMEQLLGKIRQSIEGRILKVDLEQEWRVGGRIWVYEAKIITPDGDVLKLEYDARTLEVLEFKGRHRKQLGRDTED